MSSSNANDVGPGMHCLNCFEFQTWSSENGENSVVWSAYKESMEDLQTFEKEMDLVGLLGIID